LDMKIFDTKTSMLRDFTPVSAGRVGIYVCGPTVQSSAHIGHLRSALSYDVMARWLTHLGLQVTLVRNVTDIDDKVLEKAVEQNQDWWSLAYANELLFAADFRRLGIQAPTYEPRATGHIPQMLQLIAKLIERGHAYRALDGSANVYFDTASWPSYGELTNQSPEDMDGQETSADKKRAQDFALWKAAKPNEPETASWDSEFGRGRPGWHIECSAMASHYLGTQFDIHGGGLDLRFPHHENELAQSTAASHEFANYWVHNGLVTVSGQKMSKSLGNSVYSSDLFALASAQTVRYYLSSAHYRSVLDYQPSVLAEADAALGRILGFLERASRELAPTRFSQPDAQITIPDEFAAEMNDDFNVPAALAVVHELVRAGNSDLDEQRLREAAEKRDQVNLMLEVLGLAPSQWQSQLSQEHQALDSLVQALIAERDRAREAKDYATADRIRDQLSAAGIELSDSQNQTHWSLI
jgi:cysteinyl-tRNA synthetase